MGSFVDNLADEIIQSLTDLFTPSDTKSFADQYLRGTANAFETPARGDPQVQEVLVFNELIFDISVLILGIFLIFLVTKLVFSGGGNSNILKAGTRAILGIGLLAYNVELVFALFEFTDGFVSTLSWARVHYESQTAASTFGPSIGVNAIATSPIGSAFFGAKMLGYLLTWLAVAIIMLSLYLRDIILLGVIAFAPLMTVIWAFGPLIGIGRVGAGTAARALFFVIPLIVLLTMIEILNPGGGVPLYGHIIKSGAILAAVWISVKLSAAGQIVTSGVKTAATGAVLLGAAAAIGGTGLATRAGLSKAFGKPGYMMAKAMGDSDSTYSGRNSGFTYNHESGNPDAATYDRGTDRIDYSEAWDSPNPEEQIKETWEETPPTIRNEPYLDVNQHRPDVNPIKEDHMETGPDLEDPSDTTMKYEENHRLEDPDWEQLPMEDRKKLGVGDMKADERGLLDAQYSDPRSTESILPWR